MDFKISLAAARVNARLTQEEAAKLLGVGKQTVRNWETGKTKPTTAVILAMSQIYAIPADVISLPET